MTPESISPVPQELPMQPIVPMPSTGVVEQPAAPLEQPESANSLPAEIPTSSAPPEDGSPNPDYLPGTASLGSANLGASNHPASSAAQTPASVTVSRGDPGLPGSNEMGPTDTETPETTPSSQIAAKPEVLSGGVENPTGHHGVLGKLAIKLKIMH